MSITGMQNSRPHRSLYCILVGIQRGRSRLSTGAGRKEDCHVRRYERLRLRPSTTTSALSRGTCPSAGILGRPNATSGAPNGQGVCARCCSTPPILEKAVILALNAAALSGLLVAGCRWQSRGADRQLFYQQLVVGATDAVSTAMAILSEENDMLIDAKMRAGGRQASMNAILHVQPL